MGAPVDPWVYVGTMGIVFTALQLLPQVVKSIRTGRVRDLSLGLSVIVGLSALTWTIYGLHLRDVPLVVANAMNLVGATVLTVLKLREVLSGARDRSA